VLAAIFKFMAMVLKGSSIPTRCHTTLITEEEADGFLSGIPVMGERDDEPQGEITDHLITDRLSTSWWIQAKVSTRLEYNLLPGVRLPLEVKKIKNWS